MLKNIVLYVSMIMFVFSPIGWAAVVFGVYYLERKLIV